jgi:DNA-binding IclR family transcriptional regulator
MDSLTPTDLACLDVIRAHSGTVSTIALRAKLTMKEAAASLARLSAAGLVQQAERHRWEANARKARGAVRTPRACKRSIPPGSTAERMLEILERPATGPELARILGVTLQRVHQLVVRLSAMGLVKVGDINRPLRAVWRTGQKAIVLDATAAKVLNAVPEGRGTTSGKIAVAIRRPTEVVDKALSQLTRRGFVERDGDAFRLTATGLNHWQHRTDARRAAPAPLPVKSERVHDVLTCLLEQGPTRTRDIGHALGIERASINALMQYLKRKGLVQKSPGGLNAPHELTQAGRKVLGELTLDLAA